MLVSYIITSQSGNQMTLRYKKGCLVGFDGMETPPAPLWWMYDRLPRTFEDLDKLVKEYKFTCVEVPEDLSFNRFWETYNYKVGNKKNAEKLWNNLTDDEKIQVLLAIPKYDRWLKTKNGIEKIYPERFISQRRFENEFK